MIEIDRIISESIGSYLSENLLVEKKNKKGKKKDKKKGNKKDKRFRKKALKSKGGIRKDLDVEDEKTYNKNVDDQEQSSVEEFLNSGFVNKKKVAEKLYSDHTPNGAQSQLNKKLNHDKSDSGSTYKLKNREVKKLRHIIARYLN
jgi:hypothetical protein